MREKYNVIIWHRQEQKLSGFPRADSYLYPQWFFTKYVGTWHYLNAPLSLCIFWTKRIILKFSSKFDANRTYMMIEIQSMRNHPTQFQNVSTLIY